MPESAVFPAAFLLCFIECSHSNLNYLFDKKTIALTDSFLSDCSSYGQPEFLLRSCLGYILVL